MVLFIVGVFVGVFVTMAALSLVAAGGDDQDHMTEPEKWVHEDD